jgi:hypothetical protein
MAFRSSKVSAVVERETAGTPKRKDRGEFPLCYRRSIMYPYFFVQAGSFRHVPHKSWNGTWPRKA